MPPRRFAPQASLFQAIALENDPIAGNAEIPETKGSGLEISFLLVIRDTRKLIVQDLTFTALHSPRS
jgi:hypothetical protein